MRAVSPPAPGRPGQAGLSLMELVVGLAVASFAVALAYKTFLFFNVQAVTQKRISTGQAELLPIQGALEKNLRRAGFGIPLHAARLKPPNREETVDAMEFPDNGGLPDGLIIRGNFTGLTSQLREDFPRSASAMSLYAGAAGEFSAGDIVLLDDREHQEYLVVQGVDAGASRLTTGARIHDYPAGTQVVRVNTVEFRPEGDTLAMIVDGETRILTGNLSDFRLYPVLADGTLDSVPPVLLESVKSVEYRVRVRIPKAGGQGYLYRDAVERVLLRNFQ